MGVYGLDVYNLYDAAAAVAAYLDGVDPSTARRVRAHYGCFDRYAPSTEAYGVATRRAGRSCEAAAAAALKEMQGLAAVTGHAAAEARFAALHQAEAVVGAEQYVRATYSGAYAWNLRDQRMADAADRIAGHVAQAGAPGRVVIWAHNSHVGDARATEMPRRGEVNLGQLLRERHGRGAFLVGFLTHSGKVMAAPEWGAPARSYRLRPARRDSHAAALRNGGLRRALLVLRDRSVPEALAQPRLQRAVGVIYLPDREREAHYFEARLPQQYDAVAYIDETTALTPLP